MDADLTIGKILGILLFLLSISSEAGFSIVSFLVFIVKWIDKVFGWIAIMIEDIFGLDYQTFWILCGLLFIIWLTILFSYWMHKLIQAINRLASKLYGDNHE